MGTVLFVANTTFFQGQKSKIILYQPTNDDLENDPLPFPKTIAKPLPNHCPTIAQPWLSIVQLLQKPNCTPLAAKRAQTNCAAIPPRLRSKPTMSSHRTIQVHYSAANIRNNCQTIALQLPDHCPTTNAIPWSSFNSESHVMRYFSSFRLLLFTETPIIGLYKRHTL